MLVFVVLEDEAHRRSLVIDTEPTPLPVGPRHVMGEPTPQVVQVVTALGQQLLDADQVRVTSWLAVDLDASASALAPDPQT